VFPNQGFIAGSFQKTLDNISEAWDNLGRREWAKKA
jgi:hypothetical protein